MSDVLDEKIRSFLIELVDATPPPPEFDEIATVSWSRSHNDATTRPPRSSRRSGLLAAAVAGAVVLAIGLAILVIGAGDTHSHLPATNSTSQANGYYKATTTLLFDPSPRADQNPAGVPKLAQLAVVTTTGDVPDAVAAKLGNESGPQLARRITIKTDRRTSTVAITAIARTPEQATQLADAFSAELIRVLNQKGQDSYAAARDQLQTQLQALQAQADSFLAQLAVVPRIPNYDTLKAQYDAVQREYQSTYGSYSQLNTLGPPMSQFTTLGEAQPVRITKTEYDKRRHES